MISISCLESKLLNNNNWYGRFQLAPFQKGEGLTVANALRRTLLAEKSNFFITWVDFYNAEIPYSVLTGMRESIFDILLNLKQVIFTSDKIIPNSNDFLKRPPTSNFRAQKVKFSAGSAYRFQEELAAPSMVVPKTQIIGPNREKRLWSAGESFPTTEHPDVNHFYQATSCVEDFPHRMLGVKLQAGLNREIHNEISKGFNNYSFPVRLRLSFHSKQSDGVKPNQSKNLLRSSLNQAINMILPVTKKDGISKTLKLQNLKNQTIEQPCFGKPKHDHIRDLNYSNYGCFQTKKIFCENQILGKTINQSDEKKSSLVPLKVFPKNSSIVNSILDVSNSKKTDSTYIGYICAKGPAIIYAKNIKLPKGLKCVDPDKYIVTLADDGLFYLRFALTTEIKTFPLIQTSNIPTSINQGIKFNMVKNKTFPKILFNKEMQSCFSFNVGSFMSDSAYRFEGEPAAPEKKKQNVLSDGMKPKQKYPLVGFQPIASLGMKRQAEPHRVLYNKTRRAMPPRHECRGSVWPEFRLNVDRRKRKRNRESPVELYDYKIKNEYYTKNLIKEQRLLLTNDEIKQFNFQNTSITANIQKTCLNNLQIKHYYYKSGRFDRFLFDLIKSFKPILQSTYYNDTFKNIFYQSSNWKILTDRTFQHHKDNRQLAIDYKAYLLNNVKQTQHPFFKSPSLKNKYFGFSLLKWQKIFKSIKTNSIYDYLQKLGISEATTIGFLPITSNTEIGIELLTRKLISTVSRQAPPVVSLQTKRWDRTQTYSKGIYNDNHWLSGLQKPFIERFLNICLSFQCFKNNILCFLRSYSLQYTYSSDFLNKNPVLTKQTLRYLLFQSGSIYTEKLITKIQLLRQWSFSPIEDNKEITISVLKKKIRLFFFMNNLFWRSPKQAFSFSKKREKQPYSIYDKIQVFKGSTVETVKLVELLSWINEKEISKNDNHLRKFFFSAFACRFKEGKKSSVFGIKVRRSLSFHSKHPSLMFIKEGLGRVFGIPKTRVLSDGVKPNTNWLSSDLWSGSACRFTPSEAMEWDPKDKFKNQAWISSNRYQFFQSTQLSTTLRAKPSISIRQVSYKPIWMLENSYSPNTYRLPYLFNNISYLTNQNTFVNTSDFGKKNVGLHLSLDENSSLFWKKQEVLNGGVKPKTRSNPITKNNVVLKPIYLNVEQIIYILKQTTKFRKNQRINSVFLDTSTGLKNTHSKKSYFSKLVVPSQIWILGNNFIFKNNSLLYTSKLPSIIDGSRYGPPPFKNQSNWQLKPIPEINFNYFVNGTKKMVEQFFFIRFSKYKSLSNYHKQNYSNYSRLFLVLRNIVFGCNQQSMYYQYVFNNILQWNLITNNSFYPSNLALSFNFGLKKTASVFYKAKPPFDTNVDKALPRFYQGNLRLQASSVNELQPNTRPNENGFLRGIQRWGETQNLETWKGKANDWANQPYNVNIYNSKISFNLRYTYPFKYTIFETFLSFLNYHSKTVSYSNFDYIQYNESFKIYTTLAYTCLKTYEPRLPKYHNYHVGSHLIASPRFVSFVSKDTGAAYDLSKLQAKPDVLQVPSIFNSAYKWRIINNSNFNDAFIVTPCTRYLNFQAAFNLSFQVSGVKSRRHQTWPDGNGFHRKFTTDLFYLFVPILQDYFYMDFILIRLGLSFHHHLASGSRLVLFQNQQNVLSDGVEPNKSETMFCNYFSEAKIITKNKLHWSSITDTNNELTWLDPSQAKRSFETSVEGTLPIFVGSHPKKNTKLKISSKNSDKNRYNSKKSFLVSKSNMKTSLKKLAINFENIYYKNFLWNSRKITLRIGNNVILPLVANRKYSMSSFVPEKNYPTTTFTNMHMPITSSFKRGANNFKFLGQAPPRHECRGGAWPEILHYQKPPLTSIQHKILGTTNFLCSKTYPTFVNENQRPSMLKREVRGSNFLASKANMEINRTTSQTFSHESQVLTTSLQKNNEFLADSISNWQTQQSGNSFSDGFELLRSQWRPFLSGSLRHFQEKESFSNSQFVNYPSLKQNSASVDKTGFVHGRVLTSNVQTQEANKKYLLSYNQQITPEKLTSLRKSKWTETLIHGSKSLNDSNMGLSGSAGRETTDSAMREDPNNVNVKSPLINNLWSSSFFCNYSFYAISTKSDLFLQNLIQVSRANLTAYDNDSWTPNNNDIDRANSKTYSKNLEGPFFFKKLQSQYEQNDVANSSLKLYNKTIQKILKSQNYESVNYFVPSYYYHWQKAIHLAILRRFKKAKPDNSTKKIKSSVFGIKGNMDELPSNKRSKDKSNWYENKYDKQFFSHDPKTNIGYILQTKRWNRTQRLKKYERYFGNPLRRYINEKWLSFYKIILPTNLYKPLTTKVLPNVSQGSSRFQTLGVDIGTHSWDENQKFKKINQHVIKSWKSIIWTTEADMYFCFCYPLFIQNCNLPWQKSKYVFRMSKQWLNRITISLKYFKSPFIHLSQIVQIYRKLNTSSCMSYTQLSSSSNKTHQTLLNSKIFQSITLSAHLHIQNQGSYKMISYFTIKESLNSIYKVNYIVESNVESSQPIDSLAFNYNQNNKIMGAPISTEGSHIMKRFENIQRNSMITDSLTVSNFLNGIYSFAPSKTIMLNSFNELTDFQIHRSKTESENEYIQIDIWTNGELSPRQALLNAFKKLFELFYNLSKYNYLKPIEI